MKDTVNANVTMTPKTPMATLRKIGNSPGIKIVNQYEHKIDSVTSASNNNNINNDNDLSKRELFKEKLSAINIQTVCFFFVSVFFVYVLHFVVFCFEFYCFLIVMFSDVFLRYSLSLSVFCFIFSFSFSSSAFCTCCLSCVVFCDFLLAIWCVQIKNVNICNIKYY